MQNKFSNNYPIINLYNKKSVTSKIVTQMLYGENFTILRKIRNWYKIKLHTDNYVGFIIKKNLLIQLNQHIKFQFWRQTSIENL